MKTRFSTYDIVCSVAELQRLVGLRVNQVYDIDNRTYLIRFADKDSKTTLLLESGNRFHTTAFEWPKNVAPSGFTMKMRKHLKNKRLERFVQLELDRIVDLQFGMGEAAYHIILELYDRGNIILTDHERTILNILRPHVEGEEVRFAVREKYPESRAKERSGLISDEKIVQFIRDGRPGDTLKRVLNPVLDYGPAVIDHVLQKYGLADVRIADIICPETKPDAEPPPAAKGNKKNKAATTEKNKPTVTHRTFDFAKDLQQLVQAINEAESMINKAKTGQSKGYIIQKRELRVNAKDASAAGVATGDVGTEQQYFDHNIEYHPFLFDQHSDQLYKEFASFDASVDEFYSTFESQKIDVKTMQQERDALKKLSNVKRDHMKRLDELNKWQVFDKHKADLITRNQTLVDNAILAIRSAIATQLPWPEIQNLVKAAQSNGDQVAGSIRQLKLEKNHISMLLADPYENGDDENGEKLQPTVIDIDLGLSAYANATRYYDNKRTAAKKQQRTIESSTKALKSAERKTQQSLKEMRNISNISKARKVYWFEKFYWFISTENYLVIGGRDQQQNELIVKRYMRATDIYVHAEIQGASSVVIRNPSGADVPPKTLLEAGTMAISYSVAWDAKVVTSAYWVRSHQVSKTAPTGEYLGTGSFMIRGKKNFLPPCHLILGMSFLFKLEDGSVARHAGERRVRTFEGEEDTDDGGEVDVENQPNGSVASRFEKVHIENEQLAEVVEEDEEIELLDSDDEPNPPQQSADINDEAAAALDSDDEADESAFPDTHVNIEHDTGKVSVQADPVLQRLASTNSQSAEQIDSSVVYMGDSQPVIIHTGAQTKIRQQKKDRDARKGKRSQAQVQAQLAAAATAAAAAEAGKGGAGLKRGQKGKLKKIREKYKDQDEEEKRIRMDILKSAGTHKLQTPLQAPNAVKPIAGKPYKKAAADEDDDVEEVTEQEGKTEKPGKGTDNQRHKDKESTMADDEEIDDAPTSAAADVDMLDSLTGIPVDEDELLFAVPVIAPYQALVNYKFKVKITPGTGKRGKASKTALLIFTRDKTCSQREKDLLKGVKDETIARNMPGKVKLSAPQMHKVKK